MAEPNLSSRRRRSKGGDPTEDAVSPSKEPVDAMEEPAQVTPNVRETAKPNRRGGAKSKATRPRGEPNYANAPKLAAARQSPTIKSFVPAHPAPSRPARPEWRPAEDRPGIAADQEEARTGPRLLVAVAGAVPAIVALLVAANLLDPGSQAGPSPGATQERRDSAVEGVTSMEETFDAFPMRSRLPDPWTVRGDGPVEIAALPTSVDRSVRIASAEDGSTTEACLSTGAAAGADLRIALDYRLGRLPTTDVTLLVLGPGGSGGLGVVLKADGGPIQVVVGASGGAATGQPGSSASAGGAGGDASSAWQRLDLSVSSRGELTWTTYDGTGADAGSGSASAPDLASQALDTLCLRSPAGQSSGWIAIDDLLIQT